MKIINHHKESLKKIRIPLGIGNALILTYPAGITDAVWVKDRIPDLLRGKGGIPVKSSRFTTVLQFRHSQSGELFYCKDFHDRGIKDKIKNLFGFHRSRKAFRAGKILLQKGFLTPLPVMYGTEHTFFFMKKNFLITKEVPGERTYQYFQSRFQLPLSIEQYTEKRALISAAGKEIGRLHRHGIFHGDLRVGNIIINGTGSSVRLYFIDNERTRHYRNIPERKRFQNLVQLNMVLLPQITRTDRLRFLNAYLTETAALVLRRKEILRQIGKMTQKRYENKFR